VFHWGRNIQTLPRAHICSVPPLPSDDTCNHSYLQYSTVRKVPGTVSGQWFANFSPSDHWKTADELYDRVLSPGRARFLSSPPHPCRLGFHWGDSYPGGKEVEA
jgi:hypothetical protein